MGRALTRRSGGRCELCADSGVPLRAVEVEPVPEEPEPDETVFVCDRCQALVAATSPRVGDGAEVRFLEGAVWSEVPAAQVLAVRLLRRIAAAGTLTWPHEVLDGLYLEPEIEARVGAAP